MAFVVVIYDVYVLLCLWCLCLWCGDSVWVHAEGVHEHNGEPRCLLVSRLGALPGLWLCRCDFVGRREPREPGIQLPAHQPRLVLFWLRHQEWAALQWRLDEVSCQGHAPSPHALESRHDVLLGLSPTKTYGSGPVKKQCMWSILGRGGPCMFFYFGSGIKFKLTCLWRNRKTKQKCCTWIGLSPNQHLVPVNVRSSRYSSLYAT